VVPFGCLGHRTDDRAERQRSFLEVVFAQRLHLIDDAAAALTRGEHGFAGKKVVVDTRGSALRIQRTGEHVADNRRQGVARTPGRDRAKARPVKRMLAPCGPGQERPMRTATRRHARRGQRDVIDEGA
jgi:hypothetical protein